jgi:tetratricopeptide (TPR) repeat protein
MVLKTKMQVSPEPTWTFGQLLNWHLARGTRPAGVPTEKGVPWQNKDFANSVGKVSAEAAKGERTVRNWRNDDTSPSPADFAAILRVLFEGRPQYAGWQSELTEKYHAARAEGDGEPAAESQMPFAACVPTKPLRCLGREEDLKSVVDALTAAGQPTAVLVLGGPGMGKTTLTRQASNDEAVVARFGGRRWFLELETAIDARTFETAIITALGLDPTTAKLDIALASLAQAPGLLMLDNLETPWDGDRAAVERLLGRLHGLPQLALLASIRGNEPPGGLRWSRQRTMHPIEWPHDRDLFLDIAKDIKPDDPHIASLLKDLGGVPLAIELVAMQAASSDTLAAIFAEWQRIGVSLAQRRGVEPSRLTSLEKSLELSFNSSRLGDAGRRLFAILGQLPAGIGAEDLEAVLGDTAFEGRQGLLSSGLGVEHGERLDLLPPVRDHARRHCPPDEADSTAWQTLFFTLAHVQGNRMFKAEGGAAIRRLAAELPNLDAALRAAIASGNLKLAVAACQGISATMGMTGLGAPWSIRDLATACSAKGDATSEACCIFSFGHIALGRSDHESARKAYEQALLLYRQIGNISGEATCIQSLGDIALRRSDHQAARDAYEQALSLHRQIGNITGEATCIQSLGDIALRRADHQAARDAYEQALPLYRQIGAILGEANCIQSLGEIALRRSDHEAARKAYEQALPLYRQIGAILGEANCIHSLGDIALYRFDDEAACNSYDEALQLYHQVGDILGEANCIQRLGDSALHRLDHEAARKAYEQALPLYRQVGAILGEANCIRGLGDIALKRSDHDVARDCYQMALALFEQISDPYGIGMAHFRLTKLSKEQERSRHLAAARAAWTSANRPDLVALLAD